MSNYTQFNMDTLGSPKSITSRAFKAECATLAPPKLAPFEKGNAVVIRRKGVVVETVSTVEMLRAEFISPVLPDDRRRYKVGGRWFFAL